MRAVSSSPDPMEQLRARFRDRLGQERMALAQALREGDSGALRAICHRIAGAGGMFGYPNLSGRASDVEAAVDDGVPATELQMRTAALLSSIDEALAR